MGFLQQYKDSLKTIEAEEILDLLIFRPLAFLFVKATYRTNLTPNQVSSTAMLVGVTAGILFGFGSHNLIIIGGCLYFLCNMLDCADGQIARLKGNGTYVGRMVDGFIDYVVSSAVFLGIGIGMTKMFNANSLNLWGNSLFQINPILYIWILTVLAGLSSAIQAIYFDYYRNKFLEYVYGRVESLEDQIKEYTAEKERLQREGRGGIDLFLIRLYLKYTSIQVKAQGAPKVNIIKPDPNEYFKNNKLLLRIWSFIGSTTHITLCIISSFLNNFELFLFLCIVPLNLLFLTLYFVQKRVDASFTK